MEEKFFTKKTINIEKQTRSLLIVLYFDSLFDTTQECGVAVFVKKDPTENIRIGEEAYTILFSLLPVMFNLR